MTDGREPMKPTMRSLQAEHSPTSGPCRNAPVRRTAKAARPHAPHWRGQTAVANHMRTDVLSLVTMQMVTANMVPVIPGTWLFHCHVGPHSAVGMNGLFRVENSTAATR